MKKKPLSFTPKIGFYEEYKQCYIIHADGQLQVMPWQMKQFTIVDNNGCLIHIGEDLSGEED